TEQPCHGSRARSFRPSKRRQRISGRSGAQSNAYHGRPVCSGIGDRHYRAQGGGVGAPAPKHGTGAGGTRRGDGRTGGLARPRSQQSDRGNGSERQRRQRLIATGKVKIGELNALLADIAADGRRAGEIVQSIRNMVRKGKIHHALIQIEGIIHDLLRIVHAEAVERDVTVSAEVDSDGGRVWADRVQLLQVFLNLTLNAFEAMSAMRSDARRLVIHAGSNGNGEIVVSVRDSGPGFPEGLVEQLFEPFFSTKAEGTGMGLAISRSIIEAHGGTLSG